MARIIFENKENARQLGGLRKNKGVAEDFNEIKESVNALYDSGAEWPQYSTAARNLLTSTPVGFRIFNTTESRPEFWNGSAWLPVAAGIKSIHCGSSPNYPAALKGDVLQVTGAGKIGGTSGKNVFEKDIVVCLAANAGGTQAAVGANWRIVRDIPQLTQVQIDALSTPNEALLVYNTDESWFEYYHDGEWKALRQSIPTQLTDNVDISLEDYYGTYYVQWGDAINTFGMLYGDLTSFGAGANDFYMQWHDISFIASGDINIEATNSFNVTSAGLMSFSALDNISIRIKTGKRLAILDDSVNDSFVFYENGQFELSKYATLNFADDTAAAAGGVPLGGVYHNAGALRVRIV